MINNVVTFSNWIAVDIDFKVSQNLNGCSVITWSMNNHSNFFFF